MSGVRVGDADAVVVSAPVRGRKKKKLKELERVVLGFLHSLAW